jgi:predicted DNA-binding transcriptional regulator YafY
MKQQAGVPSFRMLGAEQGHVIMFRYPNPRGEMERRRARPHIIVWAEAQQEAAPEWLMEATDVERNEIRLFRLKHMEDVARV